MKREISAFPVFPRPVNLSAVRITREWNSIQFPRSFPRHYFGAARRRGGRAGGQRPAERVKIKDCYQLICSVIY